MPRYEYKVVPAPTKGLKAKGVKGAEARFSHAIQELMNGLAGYGWEYQRAETLPSIERSGLTSTTTEWRNLLVFRRLRENDAEAFAPELLPPPDAAVPAAAGAAVAAQPEPQNAPVTPAPEEAGSAETSPERTTVPESSTPSEPLDSPEPERAQESAEVEPDPAENGPTTVQDTEDNGVEDTADVEGVSPSLTQLAEARKGTKTDA